VEAGQNCPARFEIEQPWLTGITAPGTWRTGRRNMYVEDIGSLITR